jgi:hypothetical protein
MPAKHLRVLATDDAVLAAPAAAPDEAVPAA